MKADVSSKLPEVLWSPAPEAVQKSNLGAYIRWLEERRRLRFANYDDLWRWSIANLEDFWGSLWDYFDVLSHSPYTRVLDAHRMPGAHWFEGATLNYAENALRWTGDRKAIIGRSQTRGPVDLSFDELREQVAWARVGLQRLGVGRGDVVAAYLPNIPETVIALLATASLGAIWSSCAPEFGVRSVTDRFSQIEPKVLLAVDGYRYRERAITRTEEVAQITSQLPSLRHTVWVPYLDPDFTVPPGATAWSELLSETAPLAFEAVPFEQPLYVLYSSGTTGLPKPIVHAHGSITIEHLKVLSFHQDLGPESVLFQVSSTGWMMWNWMVSALLVGASVVTFDGDVNHPDPGALWRLISELEVTNFGTSAAWLSACRKLGLTPGRDADFSKLGIIGSTGSPLPAETYRWVYEAVTADVLLNSGSGGTDVCTGFVTGCPLLPVVAGEISGPALGVAVAAFDPDGHSIVGEQGELVITEPMPSMPLGFWNDDDGSRLRAAYFDMYPGVWRHGDWLTVTERGTYIISGRSDSTLNRAGVRMGTAEFYDVVEAFDEVEDSLVIHLEDPDGGPGRLILLVALIGDGALDADLESRLKGQLRSQLSPRHVPDVIYQIPAVPRTLTGKKLEVPVKRVLRGADIDQVVSRGSITHPEALETLARLSEREAPGG